MISYARKTHTNMPLPAQVRGHIASSRSAGKRLKGTGGPTRTAPFAARDRRSRTIESFVNSSHTPCARRIHSLRPAVPVQARDEF